LELFNIAVMYRQFIFASLTVLWDIESAPEWVSPAKTNDALQQLPY